VLGLCEVGSAVGSTHFGFNFTLGEGFPSAINVRGKLNLGQMTATVTAGIKLGNSLVCTLKTITWEFGEPSDIDLGTYNLLDAL
jgi:hypothetical protein